MSYRNTQNVETPVTIRRRMETLHRTREMLERVRDLVESGTRWGGQCKCGLSPYSLDTWNGARFYVWRLWCSSNCRLHFGAPPMLYLTVREHPRFPFDASRVELVAGPSETKYASLRQLQAPPISMHKDPTKHRTVYRDIELAHEDERVANRHKFDGAAPTVPDDVEITKDNWMDFI